LFSVDLLQGYARILDGQYQTLKKSTCQ
jgi:hypothetical protein